MDYVPAGVKVGRTHDDFLAYVAEHHLERHVELDTVIGRVGGKVIMTVHFTACNFMIGLLMDNKSAVEGAMKFSSFKNRLRNAGVSIPSLFDVLLCDNGGEFSDVFSFENDDKGNREIPLFFCDPMCSSQKAHDFSQETVNLIFSHVNSVSRSIYMGKTPYDMFSFFYNDRFPSLLGIDRIPPDRVVQSPALLAGIADLSNNL